MTEDKPRITAYSKAAGDLAPLAHRHIPAMRDRCRKRLAAYKVPKKVDLRGEPPKSPVGKVLRKDLRARSG